MKNLFILFAFVFCIYTNAMNVESTNLMQVDQLSSHKKIKVDVKKVRAVVKKAFKFIDKTGLMVMTKK